MMSVWLCRRLDVFIMNSITVCFDLGKLSAITVALRLFSKESTQLKAEPSLIYNAYVTSLSISVFPNTSNIKAWYGNFKVCDRLIETGFCDVGNVDLRVLQNVSYFRKLRE